MSLSWSEANFIFMNSLTFSESQMLSILEKTNELKSGTKLVLATGTGPSPLDYLEVNYMKLISEVQCYLSCGRATFFVLERL